MRAAAGLRRAVIPARVASALAIAFALVVWPMLARPRHPPTAPARPFPRRCWSSRRAIGLHARPRHPADGARAAARRLDRRAVDGAGADLRAGVAPDPMPAIGNIMLARRHCLAVASGLHVKAAMASVLRDSCPWACRSRRPDVARLGGVAQAFALGFSLAAPFVIAALRLQPRARRDQPRHAAAHGRLHRRPGDHRRRHPDALMLAAPVILHFWGLRST